MKARLADLEFLHDGDVLVGRLSGEVDSSNASDLRLAIQDALLTSMRGLVLDLTGTTYLDSTGIALIFELARGLEARRQALRLVVGPEGPVRRVLELCEVSAVAPVDRDPAGAVAAMQPEA